jgi:hypothetical protein
MKRILGSVTAAVGFCAMLSHQALAWDYEGHRVVNQLALSCLPSNFPAFVQAPEAAERIAFLAGEADRWRNVQDLPLRHGNGPDHYIDLEQLKEYDLNPEMLPVFRYDFVAQLATFRGSHPEKSLSVAGANEDHTRGLVGLLPWAIAENYSRLKSSFAYLKAYQQDGGKPEEIANAQADVVYVMGLMGHYVGDASQPLHTTIHHHGWVGPNPNGYSTDSRIHSWIDGGFLGKCGGADYVALKTRLRPAQLISIHGHAAKPEETFQAAMLFIMEQNRLVEPLYQLEKVGKLSTQGEPSLAGKTFLEGQLAKSGQFLSDIWLSAWQQAPPDTFLQRQLQHRKHPVSAGTQ